MLQEHKEFLFMNHLLADSAMHSATCISLLRCISEQKEKEYPPYIMLSMHYFIVIEFWKTLY